MSNVYVLGACRTPIGKFGGTLANVSAADLGAIVIKETVTRAGMTDEQIRYVIDTINAFV